MINGEQENEGAHRGADMRWLLAGAAAGLIAAGVGLLRQDEAAVPLPDTAIARVNGQLISRERYERTLARLRVNETDDALDARLRDRLVDDELLVQRALELGMAQSDAEVRSAIVNSLIASVTAEADAAGPTDEQLDAYLNDHPERFSYVTELSVAAWQSDDESIAQAFVTELRETGEAALRSGIELVPDLPPGLMSIELLRAYLGPGIAAAATEMPPGSSAVFARRGRWLVVQVQDSRSGVPDGLDGIRSRVLQDYRRNLARQLLDDYLLGLRQRADVELALP